MRALMARRGVCNLQGVTNAQRRDQFGEIKIKFLLNECQSSIVTARYLVNFHG